MHLSAFYAKNSADTILQQGEHSRQAALDIATEDANFIERNHPELFEHVQFMTETPVANRIKPATVPCDSSQSFRDSITEISRLIIADSQLIIADSHIPDFNQQVFYRYKATDFMKSMEECLEYLMKEYTKRPDGKLIVGFGYSVAYYALLLLLLQRHHAKDPIRNISAFSMAIMNRIVELLVKKNHDYGNSFGNQLAKHGPIVFKIRMEDKISRLCTLLTTDAQVKDESIEDTLRDIIGYCILFIHHYTK